MALVTLQTIFQDAFPAYEVLHPLPAYVRKAARAIMLTFPLCCFDQISCWFPRYTP